jgi:TRAP-type uncharacterized transport system substrate-binding protein
MKSLRPHLVVFALSLLPAMAALAQGPTRTFFEIPIGTYPGLQPLERGVSPGIASGTHVGVYIRFAEDISNLCERYEEGPGRPKFRLNVFATEGAFDSLKRLRKEDEVQLAIVQSDLWYYAKLFGSPSTSPAKTQSKVEKIQDSWREISQDIRMLLPLYEESIHILVRPEDKAAGKFKDLTDLFLKEARVNIGTKGSGAFVTCTLLEQILTQAPGGTGGKRWKPSYDGTEAALSRLVNKEDDSLDAVILVGGVPFPALEKFGVDHLKRTPTRNLFKDLTSEPKIAPQMALLPFGETADQLMDGNLDFKGYLPAKIEVSNYTFLQTESAPVKTRSIMACLVTHAKYNDAAGKEAHKIQWVRHILYRVLNKMRPNSESGLVDDFGVPHAGDKWKETARNLQRVNQKIDGMTWDSFGWKLHDDRVLREMLSTWGEGLPGGSAPSLIDPDNPF